MKVKALMQIKFKNKEKQNKITSNKNTKLKI